MEQNIEQKLKVWEKRAFSWSQISSFLYSKDQWFKSYILGERQDSEEMRFGSEIGKRLETDPTYLPEIPRYGMEEYPFKVRFNGIELVGYADSFDHFTCKRLGERKTGKKKWDKKRVDKHDQITMYCFMNFLLNKVKPEEVEIVLSWIPTDYKEDEDFKKEVFICGEVINIKTKRTMADIMRFGGELIKIRKEMEEYIAEKLSTDLR